MVEVTDGLVNQEWNGKMTSTLVTSDFCEYKGRPQLKRQAEDLSRNVYSSRSHSSQNLS